MYWEDVFHNTQQPFSQHQIFSFLWFQHSYLKNDNPEFPTDHRRELHKRVHQKSLQEEAEGLFRIAFQEKKKLDAKYPQFFQKYLSKNPPARLY